MLIEKKLERSIRIINAPSTGLDWFTETGWGVRFELLRAEFERIEKYYSSGHIASFSEAINYFKWKESSR